MIRSQSQPQDFVDEGSASQDVGFKRELTLYDALMINVGTTLASAIFIVPAIVLATTGTAFMSSLVWIVAGGLSWCGAVTFSELAVMYPRAGGQYVYLKQAFPGSGDFFTAGPFLVSSRRPQSLLLPWR